MAPKRALEDVNSGLHPDRAVALGISHTAGPSAKRRKHHHGVGTQDPLQENISSSKKRVRNIERLFQRKEHLPAHVKNELERELLAHKATIANKTFQKKRSKMISKYHMVRFFGKPFSTQDLSAGPVADVHLTLPLQNGRKRCDSRRSSAEALTRAATTKPKRG